MTDRMDIQEYVDIWASYLIGAQLLGIDGLGAWVVRIASPWKQEPGWNEFALNYSQALDVLTSFVK